MSLPDVRTGYAPPDAADQTAKHEARETWLGDRAQLVFVQPMVASLALQLEIVPVVDQRLPTAATDGRAVYINPYWLRTLAPAERLFVLAHEVWHNALLHFRRCGGRDPRRWNLAIDHEVNALLRQDGFTAPDDAVYFSSCQGWSAEQVYEYLDDLLDQPSRPIDADVHLDAGGLLSEPPTFDEKFGPIAGKWDSDFPGRIEPAAADEWVDRVVALGPLFAGRMPGALQSVIQKATRPSLPWNWLLRDFVSRAAGGRLRWLPPSRRHLHRGLYLPSRRDDVLQIAVAVDTSGSTIGAWGAFVAELRTLLRSFGRYELRLLQCDAVITSDTRHDDTHPVPDSLTLSGGGGTDFSPVFARLSSSPPQALVFFTDGDGEAPAEAPAYPVLWLLTPGGVRPTPWGRVLQLPGKAFVD